MVVRIVLLLVLSGAVLFAQNPVLLRDTYRIGSDQQDAPLVQSDPRLFHNDSDDFLVAWEDLRFGRQDYFFRRVSSDGTFLSDPKPINGNRDILFLPGNQFIAFSGRWSPYMFDDSYYSVAAQRYVNGEPVGNEVPVSGYPTSWCGTGWMGFSYSAAALSDGFVAHVANNGYILRSKFTLDAVPVYEHVETGIMDAIYVTSATGTGGAPAIFWVRQPFDMMGTDPEHRIYARFYDAQDSVLADSVLLFTFSGLLYNLYGAEISAPMYIKPVNNNAYRVMYFYLGKIYTTVVSHNGTIISGPDSLAVPDISADGDGFRGISISNTREGSFDVIVTTNQLQNGQYGYHVYKFFTDNSPVQTSSFYSTVRHDLTRYTAIYSSGKMFTPYTEAHDVFVRELQGFIQTNSVKLCDDPPQSNESNKFLIPLGQSGSFIAGYLNEKGMYATRVNRTSSAADTISNPLPGPHLGVFKNGTLFSIRPAAQGENVATLVDIYNSDFVIMSTDSIRRQDGSVFLSARPVTFRESNSGTLVYAVNDNGTLRAGIMSRSFIMQSSRTIADSVQQWDQISLDQEHADSWLIRWGGKGVFTDSTLAVREGPFTNAQGVYMGRDVVVYIYQAWGSPVNVAKMKVSLLRTGTVTDVQVGYPGQNFQVEKGDGSYYLLYYRDTGNKIVCRAYKMDGTPLKNPVVLASNINELRNFLVTVSGTSLGLTWADHSGITYDIYGRIFQLSSITSTDETAGNIPAEYVLYQNFPNPFNPETKITYSLPQSGMVELKVYDALGRLAGVIEQGEKPAGTYTVTFDGSKLASGIYFCKMKAGDYRSVIKMILMK
ncbi:MAG: T9SS type A sorting domain-containing protein [Ignavibacteriaceae bacterium]|nr:T9SS type A sorting domain-containing protein [Ignavibacteriaceae bacterium]